MLTSLRRAARTAAAHRVPAALLAVAGCTATAGSTRRRQFARGQPRRGSAAGAPGGVRAALALLLWSQGASLQCASLQVPLDYAHPAGRKITLALSRVPATAPRQPAAGRPAGQPGRPGRQRPAASRRSSPTGSSPQVAADYNIIGFDPRGVGASSPALTCDPSFFSGDRPDYIPAERQLRSRP